MADETNRYLEGTLTPAEARALAQSSLDQEELFDDLTFDAVAKTSLTAPEVRAKLDELSLSSEEALKRYVGGRLAPAEQRELAQLALGDQDLFDALAAHAAVEQNIQAPEVRSALSAGEAQREKVLPFTRRRWVIATGAIAAALAIVAAYLAINRGCTTEPKVVTSQPHNQSQPNSQAVPGSDSGAGQPILIAGDLSPRLDGSGSNPIFRSATLESREPRPEGSIVSRDNLTVTIDLGSLDGLEKDTELDVLRDHKPTGRLIVTTVFRERARARITQSAGLREHDQVRVSAPVYLAAVQQQVDALVEQRDLAKAREVSNNALNWANANSVPPGMRRKLLESLAALDYQAGDLAAAEVHYEAASSALDAAPAAEASERVRVMNNLGAMAELRGDRGKAQTLYSDALRVFQNTPGTSAKDRQAVEANLARLAKSADAKR